MLTQTAEHGVDSSQRLPILTVPNAYLDVAIDQVHTQFDTIEDYATTGLGLSKDVIETLRNELIEPAASH